VPDLAALSARDAAAGIASGALTAEAVTRACLERIAAREAVTHAWQYLDPDRAIAEARQRDHSLIRGPLHGVPIGVKDLMDTHDMPTEYGSPIYRGHRPAADAACVALARAAGAVVIARNGEAIAQWVEERLGHLSSSRHAASLGHRLAQRVREFRLGLNTVRGPVSLLWLTLVSVGMWYVIGLAYKAVTHSYGMDALDIPLAQILILMGSSMVGSMLQLPAVGGGSQTATIATLSSVFDVPPEMAASCGILLWLVTFAAVIPAGLFLAHRERLSLRKLSEESHRAEKAELEAPGA